MTAMKMMMMLLRLAVVFLFFDAVDSALTQTPAASPAPAISFLPTAPAAQAAADRASLEMNLWPDGSTPGTAVGATVGSDDGTGRVRNVGIPGLLLYQPEKKAETPQNNRIALIVCPGGGYTHLTRLVGADGAVAAFLPRNVVIISLRYRLQPPSLQVDADALADGKRAVRLARQNAASWGIDPHKIGLLGWSAGANLALNLATHFDAGIADSPDAVERQSSRPNFVALLSPWPAKQTLAAYPVSKDAPPAFIGSAKDDKTAPVQFAEGIAAAYQQADVQVSLLLVETGGHGAFTIGAPGEGGRWIERFWPWLAKIGMDAP